MKTILATGRRPSSHRLCQVGRGGYTLLEICFALFIIAMMFGAALPNLSGWLTEEQLRSPARELSSLARHARLTAIQEQVPVTLLLRSSGFAMEPRTSLPTADPAEVEAPEPPPYTLAESITFTARRWNEAKLQPVSEFRWVFQPSGLCEPIGVKFTRGAAELELDFDPLTATVADERYVFP